MIKEIKNVWWDYFSVLSSQVIAIPISIIYISLITRSLGPEKWGIVVLFMSIVQFLFNWGINWTSSSIVRFGKEEFMKEGHLRKTFGARLLIILNLIIFFSPLLFFYKDKIISYIGIPKESFYLVILMFFFYTLSDFLMWILKATGRMRQFAMSSVFRQLTLIIFIAVYLLIPISLSIQTVINFEITSYLVTTIFCILFLKLNYLFPLKINIKQVKDILTYSWPLIFIFILGYASDWMDVYFIKYFLSSHHVGIYQAAYRMMFYINTPLMAIAILAFPVLMTIKTQGHNDLISIYIKDLTPQVSLLWNIIMSILILMSGFIIKLIFGNAFILATTPLIILLLGVGFQVLAVMYTSIFLIFDWLKHTLWIAIIMCIVNFVGDLILIPKIGIIGAAIATALSYALSSALYLYVANKLISLKAYKTLLYPVLPILSFLFYFGIKEISLRICFISILILIFIIMAKRTKIFNAADLALLEKIEMPSSLRRAINQIYLTLS